MGLHLGGDFQFFHDLAVVGHFLEKVRILHGHGRLAGDELEQGNFFRAQVVIRFLSSDRHHPEQLSAMDEAEHDLGFEARKAVAGAAQYGDELGVVRRDLHFEGPLVFNQITAQGFGGVECYLGDLARKGLTRARGPNCRLRSQAASRPVERQQIGRAEFQD